MLDYTELPLHQNHIYRLFPITSLEFLRAIGGAVSQAAVLILIQIKLNSKLSHCASLFFFFFMVTNEVTQSGLASFAWALWGTRTLISAVSLCIYPPPQGVQMNLVMSLLVLRYWLMILNFIWWWSRLFAPFQVGDTRGQAQLKYTRAYPLMV